MPFRFSLASVLKLRGTLEHRELLALERRYAELAAAQGRLWEAEKVIVAAREQRERQLRNGTTAIEIQFGLEHANQLERNRAALHTALQETQRILREQLTRYRKARQERDVLEELRKRQFEVYRREQDKIEQNQRDELFLLRHRSGR